MRGFWGDGPIHRQATKSAKDVGEPLCALRGFAVKWSRPTLLRLRRTCYNTITGIEWQANQPHGFGRLTVYEGATV